MTGQVPVPLDHHLGPATETVELLIILRAFASGCSALTGVEAIANTSFGGLPVVRHWSAERSPGWSTRAGINAVGAVLTLATTFIELVSKFTEGA